VVVAHHADLLCLLQNIVYPLRGAVQHDVGLGGILDLLQQWPATVGTPANTVLPQTVSTPPKVSTTSSDNTVHWISQSSGCHACFITSWFRVQISDQSLGILSESFVAFLTHSSQTPVKDLKLDHDSFLLNPFQFIIHWSHCHKPQINKHSAIILPYKTLSMWARECVSEWVT
jgi:hypothetical protein